MTTFANRYRITRNLIFISFIIVIVNTYFYAEEVHCAVNEDSLLSKKPHDVVLNEVITLRPISGHHFNIKAPQKCGNSVPIKNESLEMQCQFDSSGEQKITVYLCDDAKTFCKPEIHKIKVSATKGQLTEKIQSKKNNVAKEKHPIPLRFIQNNPVEAQQLAKQENKLIFIDFYATWCPPCNMLDELVFADQAFSKETEGFVLTRLDADSDVSWDWKDHFKVGAYPTLIVANSDLQEIGRITGFRSKTALLDWMNEQQKLKDEPLIVTEQIVKDSYKAPKFLALTTNEAENLDMRKMRVAFWYFHKGDYQNALFYLKGLKLKEAKKYQFISLYKIAKKEQDTDDVMRILSNLVQNYPNDIALSEWMSELSESNPKLAAKFLPQLNTNLSYWKMNEKIHEQNSSLGDLYQNHALIYQNLKKPELSKARFLDCANYFADISKQSTLQVARGPNIEQAYCLLEGGKPAEAKVLYSKMIEKYKDEFTFHYNYANALRKLNEYKEAHKYATFAYNNAYGDNLLRAAALKSRLEILLDQKQSAQKTIQDTLSKVNIPSSTQLRSHRYVGELRKILSEMNENL